MWELSAVEKQFRHGPIASLLRDRLKDHLAKKNVDDEMEFL